MSTCSSINTTQFSTADDISQHLKKRRRMGVSLIETAFVLAIFAIVATTLIQMTNESAEQTRAVASAQKINEVKLAAEAFIQANIAELTNSAPVPPDAQVIFAGRLAPNQEIPAGSLQAEGFLMDSYIDRNSFGQHHALLIQRVADDRINALITTYDGQIIADDTLGLVARLIGASGGYTPSNPLPGDNGQVLGVFGGWRTEIADWGSAATRPSAGTFASALQFSAGNLITGHLYRNNIGITEANRMNTAIDMNSNEINNIQQISGSPDLTVSSNLWVERDLNVRNNLTVQESIHTIGKIIADESIETKAELVVGSDLQVGENLIVSDVTTTNSINVASDANVQGNVSTNLITATQTEIGTMAVDNQNNRNFNTEVTLSDLLSNMVFQYTYQVSESNNLVYKPVCAGGSQNSRILVQPLSISFNVKPDLKLLREYKDGQLKDVRVRPESTTINYDGEISTIDYNDTFWQVIWTGESAEGINRQAIAQTYCFYG